MFEIDSEGEDPVVFLFGVADDLGHVPEVRGEVLFKDSVFLISGIGVEADLMVGVKVGVDQGINPCKTPGLALGV